MPLGRGARLTAKVNCRQVCGRNRRPAQNKFCLSHLKSRITSTKNKLRGNKITTQFMVEVTGLEPTTFWSLTRRATKLRYTSITLFKAKYVLEYSRYYYT